MKIYIYGTGSGAIKFYDSIYKDKVEVLGFLDSDKSKEKSIFLGKRVFYPESIRESNYDYIIIASQYGNEINSFLMTLHFDSDKIIMFYNNHEVINKLLLNETLLAKITSIPFEEHVLTKKMVQKNNSLDKFFENKHDYVRYKALQLVSNEIYKNNIKGEVAEVGVYKGEFAKLINICFYNRKLFLFDTFEGFNEKDKQYDLNNSYTLNTFFENQKFKDTDMDIVLNKMEFKENCIIRKGYFPETTIDIDENFAFVSIDVDLYMPIYKSLEFFYPRLSEGGYIFLHDYNLDTLLGVKKAVQDFEEKQGRLAKVPLPDCAGTLIITK